MPPLEWERGLIVANLMFLLGQHVKTHSLGRAFATTGYKVESNPDTVLGPNISFVSRERLGELTGGYQERAPDLAVEVLSFTDLPGRVEWKTSLWLSFGAKSVWNVNPKSRTVEVVRAGGDRKVFHETDELVDDTVRGFRVAVAEIFN